MVVQRDGDLDFLVYRRCVGRYRDLVYAALDRHLPRRRAARRRLRVWLVDGCSLHGRLGSVVVRLLVDLDDFVDARRGARSRKRVLLPLRGRRDDAVSGVRGSSTGLLRPGLRGRRLVGSLPVVVLLVADGLALVRLGGLLDWPGTRSVYNFHLRVGVYARLSLAALADRLRRVAGRKLLDRQVSEIRISLLDRARLADFLLRSGLGGDLGLRQVAIGRRGRCAAQLLLDDGASLLDLLVLNLSVNDVRGAVGILLDVPLDALAVADTCGKPGRCNIILLHAQVLLLAHVLEDRLRTFVKLNVLLHRLALFDDVGEEPGLAVAREALYRVLDAAF